MTDSVVTFVGSGSMNGAIAAGLLAQGSDTPRIRASVRSLKSAEKLPQKLNDSGGRVQVFCAETNPDANRLAVSGADLVLLGVKPHSIVGLARDIAGSLGEHTLVISIAAGVSLPTVQKAVGENQPVIRCMPNTPARLGKGVLAISVGQTVSEEQVQLAEKVLGAVGTVVRVEEEQMNAVTAVSGSGPAYAFLLAETMVEAGVKLGLDRQIATRLAAQTVAGAGALLESDPHPEELRRAVTSPGGTTEQAIAAYQEGGLEQLTYRAMRACADKADQMSRDYGA